MKPWNLGTPCDACPFRSDRPAFGLRPGRAEEIAHSVLSGATFHCHKTIAYGAGPEDPETGEAGDSTTASLACAGALLVLERQTGSVFTCTEARLAAMTKRLRRLNTRAKVYRTFHAFIRAQVRPARRPRRKRA